MEAIHLIQTGSDRPKRSHGDMFLILSSGQSDWEKFSSVTRIRQTFLADPLVMGMEYVDSKDWLKKERKK